MKPWFSRIDWEVVLAAAVVAMLLVLLLLLLGIGFARAEACLVIEVPPQAVIGQPDGDTFYLFSFESGGKRKIRVEGVDTPEADELGFEEARQFTYEWLRKGSFIVKTCGRYTFDRLRSEVKRDGKTLAEALIEAGHGR